MKHSQMDQIFAIGLGLILSFFFSLVNAHADDHDFGKLVSTTAYVQTTPCKGSLCITKKQTFQYGVKLIRKNGMLAVESYARLE